MVCDEFINYKNVVIVGIVKIKIRLWEILCSVYIKDYLFYFVSNVKQIIKSIYNY